jgi:hypothetical protein
MAASVGLILRDAASRLLRMRKEPLMLRSTAKAVRLDAWSYDHR